MRKAMQIFVALVALLFLSGAAAAQAAGPPAERWTAYLDNEVSVENDVHPCTGQLAELTIVESGLVHFMAMSDGTVHFTGTVRGTFSADAEPTDGVVDATGSFVIWFGGNGLLLEDGGATGKAQAAFTWNGEGTNADGTAFRWHSNGNTVFDATGTPKLDIFNEKVHCA